METMPALKAKTHFVQLIEDAQRQPVTVTKQGRPAVVVMSMHDFDRYQRQAGERLLGVMERIQSKAADAGLTEKKLEKLLGDDR